MRSRPTIVVHDLVETLVDLPDADVERGTVGRVFEVSTEPEPAYAIEFFVGGGLVRPAKAVLSRQIRLVRAATRRRGSNITASCPSWARGWRATAISRAHFRRVLPVDADGTAVKMFDVVECLVDVPRIDVARGTAGTIVEIYTKPCLGYEVEFVYESQSDWPLATLRPAEVRLVWSAA